MGLPSQIEFVDHFTLFSTRALYLTIFLSLRLVGEVGARELYKLMLTVGVRHDNMTFNLEPCALPIDG